MKKQISQIVVNSLAVFLVLSFSSAASAAADLSDWVGIENTVAPNNYGLIGSAPQTSAGGTFEERHTPRGELADQSLVGGPFDFHDDLSMSGLVTMTAPADVDPNIFFGFYNSAGTTFSNTTRIGMAFGDLAGGGAYRVQFSRSQGTTSAVVNLDDNGAAAGGSNVFPVGTNIPFSLNYTGATRAWTASMGPSGGITVTNSGVLPELGFHTLDPLHPDDLCTDCLDRFGFLQLADPTANEDSTYTLILSNLTYTGSGAGGTTPDYNGNGTVDAADYVRWRKDPDSFGGVPAGYTAWRANFGSPAGAGSSLGPQTVPEPVTLILAIVAFGLALISRVGARTRR